MPQSTLIQTERTYLETPDSLTLEQIKRLDIDPQIMRFITNGKPRSAQESEKWLKIKLDDYKKNGFGLMPAYLKTDHSFIGWGGLKHLDNTNKIEVGYRLDKAYWGMGFATEITKAIIQYAQEQLKIKELVAITHVDNEASKNVLRKCGFKYLSKAFYYNTHVDYFELGA